ncbi:MAG: selenoneine biosynthesis selenosugar synthase SenB [Pseudonocardiaceae bacterium]
MKIAVVTPTPVDSPHGNGVTARRWATILDGLGHRVSLSRTYDGGAHDVLIALHARKSAGAVRAFRAQRPGAPVVVALTGTDLYPDLATGGVEEEVLAAATRLVVLQPEALAQLPAPLAARTTVIVQSVPPIPPRPARADCFEVALLAHLRPVKDPLRLAAAARLLPADSRIRITHLGAALDNALADRAAAESASNPRYTWLGPRAREEALQVLARSRLLALTSVHEGGANVVSEALAAGVPIVSSAIPGSSGLLGRDYPGYFPAGDTEALASLLDAAEHDRDGRYGELRRRCAAARPLVDPARERDGWASLLAELPLPLPTPDLGSRGRP